MYFLSYEVISVGIVPDWKWKVNVFFLQKIRSKCYTEQNAIQDKIYMYKSSS